MLKLSSTMQDALENLKANGRFELVELPDWNFWKSAENRMTRRIKTGTMKALEKRGIVKTFIVIDGKRRTWYAELV